MTKVVTLFLRRPDLTRAQFRDHYETRHVPMGLAANRYFGFHKYVRNHVVGAAPGLVPLREFDAFTEFSFRDLSKAVDAQAFMATPDGKALAQDELNFLDMSYHPSFAVTEDLVAGAPRDVDQGLVRKQALVLKRGGTMAPEIAADRITRFATDYAARFGDELLRLTLDRAQESPAGTPPFDALLTLWPSPRTSEQALLAFRWPDAEFGSLMLDIETVEASPELLGIA